MKCEYCGANLNLEDKVCPFCGRENPFAVQHQKEMDQFNRDYNKTKKEVLENASKSSKRTVRITIIAVLVALVAVAAVVFALRDDIRYNLQEKQIAAKKAVYEKEMEQMMIDKDYLSLEAFMSEKRISYADAFSEYYELSHNLLYYKWLVEDLTSLITFENRTYNYDSKEELIKDISERAYNILKPVEINKYNEIEFEGLKGECIESIKEDTILLLKTYFNLSDEEAGSLKTLSEARINVLLEDKYETN